jgi:hypothetical protein
MMTKGDWGWLETMLKKTLSEIAHHLLAQGHEITDPPKLVSIRDARRPSSLSLSSFNHVYISKICMCAR